MKTLVEQVQHTDFVNAEKKVVVTRLVSRINVQKIPNFYSALNNIKPLRKYLSTLNIKIQENELGIKNEYIIIETVGKAMCNDNDTFDETTGKHIALTKAQCDAFCVAETIFNTFANIVNTELLKPMIDLADGNMFAIQSTAKHVCELAGL